MSGSVPEPASIERNKFGKIVSKECPHCGEGYSSRGYNSHVRFCDSNTDMSDSESVEEVEEEVEEQDDEQGATDGRRMSLGDPEPVCPECSELVYDTADVARVLRAKGYDEKADEIVAFDYFCKQCEVVLREEETA